ncbi:MAG: hypothetical protein QME64_10160 [bacterium]|nr:hypothetical protein [bacterium]
MLNKKIVIVLVEIVFFSIGATQLWAGATDSPWLYGIHWYGNTGASDVESMSGGKGIWDLEITHLDVSQAPWWDHATSYVGHCQQVTSKGHSVVFRVQPYWSRNVPYSSDPYTLGNYARDCKSMADTLKDYCHIWQIGNEVNLDGENNRWNSTTSTYSITWQPSPAEYATTYLYCRDSIHLVTPTTIPANQIVLMQPVSPGNVIGGVRFMDGNEFLWRMIDAIPDKNKIDGFALHSYAEPGAADYGVSGFWDSIQEQLMIIDQFGLKDRPIYITEWNKHMPNATEANIGAIFLHRAETLMYAWNTGRDGEWLGQPNHNIIAATWFVYPSGYGWDEYSLQYWKTGIGSTDKELNPWYSFLYACTTFNYGKGSSGGGPTVSQNSVWWYDDFNGSSLDTASPLPDWKAEVTGSGSVAMSGTGSVRLLGSNSVNGGGGILTSGYVYGNFWLETNITITNAARAETSGNEANFDLRLREGSKGYSITFYTSGSLISTNRIILRRTNEWVPIPGYNRLVSGGINSGDNFRINVVAKDTTIKIKIYKNSGSTPEVDWTVNDSGQKVGWIRLMTWNLNEARINDFKLAGPDYVETPSLRIVPTYIGITTEAGGANTSPRTLSIYNDGNASMAWSGSANTTWLTITPTNGTVTAGGYQSATVAFNISGLTAGARTGQVTITAPGATNSPQTLTVYLSLTQPTATVTRWELYN